MLLAKCTESKHFKRFESYSPTRWGKSASPILVSLYHGFAELRNRHENENLQLNTDLHQGADSGSLLAFAYKRMLSIIISKLKGIISSKNEQ